MKQLEIKTENSRSEIAKMRNEIATFLHTESEKAIAIDEELMLVLSLWPELGCSGAE